MADITARDIMTREVLTLLPDTSVADAAKFLSDNRISGAPVVDAAGTLVGVVSDSDLIIQDVKLHFPHYINLLDSYIYLGSLAKFEATLRKAVGAKVADIMTTDIVTTVAEATIEDVATLMSNRDIGLVPVVRESQLIGVITKGDIVRSIGRD